MHWTTDSRSFRTFLLVTQLEPDLIRRRIRQARDEAGLTQQELADLLGVHKRTVENYENVRVPWRALPQLETVLNRPVGWFLRGDADESAVSEEVLRLLHEINDNVGELARQGVERDRRLNRMDETLRLLRAAVPTWLT